MALEHLYVCLITVFFWWQPALQSLKEQWAEVVHEKSKELMMEKDVYEQVQLTYRNCNKCICIHVFYHLVWKIISFYMYIYMRVNFIYWQVPTFDFVIVVHVLVSIWHFTFLQETRPIHFEIKGAWSRFVLENFKLYQISIFNVKFFFVQFFIKRDTYISIVSQNLMAVVLS